jgi:hypothetical protein
LACLGVAGGGEPEIRARIELELLAKLQASLLLVIPDALEVDPAVLRSLADLSAASGNVLRLVLFAEPAAAGGADPAARLVKALGTGATKINLGPAVPTGNVPDDASPGPGPLPPVVPALGKRRSRPIAVRSSRSQRGRRRTRAGMGLAILLLAAPVVIWTSSGSAPIGSAVPALLPSLSPPVPSSTALASSPIPQPAGMNARVAASAHPFEAPRMPVGARPVEIGPAPVRLPMELRSEAAQQLPQPDRPAPKPSVRPVATVGVSLNASPFAEIEVDGRPVGATPIGNLRLAVGLHRIRATFPDGRRVDQILEVDRLQNHFRIR